MCIWSGGSAVSAKLIIMHWPNEWLWNIAAISIKLHTCQPLSGKIKKEKQPLSK